MRTWMLSLALAGLVLSGGPVASSALTVTIGSDEMGFQQFDEDALGCTSAGPNGQLACSGQIDGPGGPSGGWTVESYDMFLDPDPTVSNQMVVTNNTAVPQDFLVTVVRPVTVTFGWTEDSISEIKTDSHTFPADVGRADASWTIPAGEGARTRWVEMAPVPR